MMVKFVLNFSDLGGLDAVRKEERVIAFNLVENARRRAAEMKELEDDDEIVFSDEEEDD